MPRFALAGMILLVLALTLASRTARAEVSPVVIEVWIGDRPDDADQYLNAVYDPLTSAGARVGAAGVGKAYEEKVSRPGLAADADSIKLASALLGAGTTAWIGADFEVAIAKLSEAIRILDDAHEAIGDDSNLRANLFKGWVYLAVSHQKLGDQEQARTVMRDALRRFPGQEVTKQQFGSDAVTLYGIAQTALQADGTGSLTVDVDDERALIYVDDLPTGAGSISSKKLPVGKHAVLVKKGSVSRLYEVEISDGETTPIDVAWAFDVALVTRPYAGFSFPDERTRDEYLVAYCERLGRALDSTTVVVVTIDDRTGRRAVTGTVYTLGSTDTPPTGTVPLESDRLRALGAFLAGDPDALGTPSIERTGRRALLPSWVTWTVIGTGLAGIATGGILFAFDEGPIQDGAQVASYLDTTPHAIGFLIGGAVVAATGIVLRLWKRDAHERERAAGLFLRVDDGLAVGVGGRF